VLIAGLKLIEYRFLVVKHAGTHETIA